MTAIVVIPALNEQESIAHAVASVPRDAVQGVIVVDNGSTDRTAGQAESAGARVVREERRGYGYACAAGVVAAGAECDVLVFMDGDGSDDGSRVGVLLEPITGDKADLVLGSRVLGSAGRGALLPHQRFGNWLTTTLIRRLYGRHVTDLPPLKAIRRPVLDDLDMREMTYGWTVEMIVKCARRGYRIAEVPVVTRARIGGRSKVSGTAQGTVLAAYYMLRTTLRYTWRD